MQMVREGHVQISINFMPNVYFYSYLSCTEGSNMLEIQLFYKADVDLPPANENKQKTKYN